MKHIWNTRKVYVEELGYVLYTTPFTIYTEDFKNRNGHSINIAGEVDMIAIDKEGRPIIIDYKTSANSFFD
ncbi:MAG: PD-(D/E)XK nuclease family protein [Prevotella sp.]|nr:PD-(D/E)XK nuclease family protein [Prevotella sp.]